MIKQLAGWQGKVNVNGKEFENISEVSDSVLTDTTIITLLPSFQRQSAQRVDDNAEHVITVRQYMTKPASPEFDFMDRMNKGIPMPMRTMVGTVEKETRGMVYMKLHGEILAERTFTCMCCGKKLTNPVSQFFGVGPECGGHNYTHPFNSDEELKMAVDAYKKVLLAKTWEGWIIKSAIIEDTIKEAVA